MLLVHTKKYTKVKYIDFATNWSALYALEYPARFARRTVRTMFHEKSKYGTMYNIVFLSMMKSVSHVTCRVLFDSK